jgi:hypothetical protein
MTRRVRIAGLAVLAVLALSLAPSAFASTLTVDLNPSTRVARLTSVSTTDLVLTYPANSALSSYLAGYNSSSSYSGSFNSSSGGVRSFRAGFHDEDNEGVSINNMTVSYAYDAKANSTALVVTKTTSIAASVAGAFNVTNGTVTAQMGWKSFYIAGALDLTLGGHQVDVNLAGSSITQSIDGRGLGVQMLTGMFEGNSLWSRSTLNFSSLSSPLSTWTRNYDAVTNTTTFSKTISGNSTFTASYTSDGQAYSLKMTSDPSASISAQGYAKASGDSLVFSKAPVYLDPLLWVAVGALAILAGAGFVLYERRGRLGAAEAGTSPLTA